MAITTSSYFKTQSHRYDECDDPKNCTRRGHWYPVADKEYKTYDEAQDAAEEDDAPYVRIFRETVARELVGGRD
jgi:hypothetical protein